MHEFFSLISFTGSSLSLPTVTPPTHPPWRTDKSHSHRVGVAQICFYNLDFSGPVTATITTKEKKPAVTHWSVLKPLNIKPRSDWPLTLHPCPLCQARTYATSWFDLSGERNAASKMAYYQPTFCSFGFNIVKE